MDDTFSILKIQSLSHLIWDRGLIKTDFTVQILTDLPILNSKITVVLPTPSPVVQVLYNFISVLCKNTNYIIERYEVTGVNVLRPML